MTDSTKTQLIAANKTIEQQARIINTLEIDNNELKSMMSENNQFFGQQMDKLKAQIPNYKSGDH